jgi:hypothetical protein
MQNSRKISILKFSTQGINDINLSSWHGMTPMAFFTDGNFDRLHILTIQRIVSFTFKQQKPLIFHEKHSIWPFWVLHRYTATHCIKNPQILGGFWDPMAQCLDANNFLVITHKSESLNLGKCTLKMI